MGASESKPEIKIILAGKTGVGKSSTGNTILKKQFFQSESSPNSKTKDYITGHGMVYNKRIAVIDTPGILSTSYDEEKVKEQLIRALVDCASELFVVVFVLKVERYTSQEREIETKIWEYFKDIDFKKALVLFTHGEELEGQTIEEFVKKSPRLQEYVEKCEGRCHVIDSKQWEKSLWGYKSNRFQVKNLLDTIDKMINENGCNTNEFFLILNEEIKKETELTDPNLSQQERREKAKMKVFKKLCIRFAGVATGTLVGALMGIATPVAALVGIMKGLKNISTNAEEAEKETLLDLDKATAGEIKKTAAAVLGATAAAAVGTSASVGAAAGATAAVEAGIAVGAAAGAVGAAASVSVGAAASVSAGAASASVGATAAVGAAAVEAGVAAGAAAGAVGAAASVSVGAAAVGAAASVSAGAASASIGATAAVGAAAVEAGVAAGAAAGATAAAGGAAASVGAAAAAGAGATAASVGATAAAVGATAVEAGVAAGAAAGATAAAAGGTVAAEAGVAAGASIGVAAGSGIAVGAVFGAAALAGAIGGGITGYKAVDNADSVFDAIKIAAKANYENVKGVIKKGEELPTKVHDELGRRL